MNFAQCIQTRAGGRRGNVAQCMRYGVGYLVRDQATVEQQMDVIRRISEASSLISFGDRPADVAGLVGTLRERRSKVTADDVAALLSRTRHEAVRILNYLEEEGLARRIAARAKQVTAWVIA